MYNESKLRIMKRKYYYISDNTRVSFTLNQDDERLWHQFCRDLKPEKNNPDKDDYLRFCKQLAANKRIRDMGKELLELAESNTQTLKIIARVVEVDTAAYELIITQILSNKLTIAAARGEEV